MSEIRFACPQCGDAQHLATFESVVRLSGATSITPNGITPNGKAELLRETVQVIGVWCHQCQWHHNGEDWRQQLRPTKVPA